MKTVIITNLNQPQSPTIRADYCSSFFCHLRGLMFRQSISSGAGLLLVQKKDDKINATIHMMFMWFDLCVVWINQACQVVDVQHAHRWGIAFTPRAPAAYVLELHTDHLNDFQIGDKVRIDELLPMES
jgi:hypothetical protein